MTRLGIKTRRERPLPSGLPVLAPALVLALSLAGFPAHAAGCADTNRTRAILDGLDLERASRTESFGSPVPTELYEAAIEAPGEPQVTRSGLIGFGVYLVELPIADLWSAVNDEDHHDLEGDYIPIERSEVIGGEPRGPERLLFQNFQRWGVGRWWVSRIRMNADLYRESEGMLWELNWHDEIEAADVDSPPIAAVAAEMKPLQSSRGSWLMIPVADDCTLVEYFTDSEPGGIVAFGQMMLAKKGVTLTLEGLVRLAREHIAEHDIGEFVRPDGEPLSPSAGSAP